MIRNMRNTFSRRVISEARAIQVEWRRQKSRQFYGIMSALIAIALVTCVILFIQRNCHHACQQTEWQPKLIGGSTTTTPMVSVGAGRTEQMVEETASGSGEGSEYEDDDEDGQSTPVDPNYGQSKRSKSW